MTTWRQPPAASLFSCLDRTWPALEFRAVGPWTIRSGGGGGQRVSAATLDSALATCREDPMALAEREMRLLGQPALFMVKDGQVGLDRALANRRYRVVDPVAVLAAPAGKPAGVLPQSGQAVFCAEPTSALREIWAAGGVGPARLAVMHRVRAPKAYLLGRYRNGPAAAAFVALHDGIAMLHALEVGPAFRRRGVGRMMSAAAAGWARAQGAHTLALLVLRANAAAIGLYKGMGLVECAAYHYRKKLERTK